MVDITYTYEKLLDACVAAEAFLTDQMSEDEKMDHMLNGCDADSCVLCKLREALELTKNT